MPMLASRPSRDGRETRCALCWWTPSPTRSRSTRGATALVIIDMQRDFLEPGGFGETLGNDVSLLHAAVAPCRALLDARAAHRRCSSCTRAKAIVPDLSDAPRAKVERGAPSLRIGAPGPMGRILVRGEPGHDIVPALAPLAGEPVVDKPGKGAFYATDLHALLAQPRHRHADRVRRHDRGLRAHDGARGERPRLPLHRAGRLLRVVLSRVPRCRPRDDQGAGRHLRLGLRFAPRAGGAVRPCPRTP